MSHSKPLKKALWNEVTKLKLLEESDKPLKFVLERDPFGDEDGNCTVTDSDRFLIIGKIYPISDMYKNHALRIQIELSSMFPFQEVTVRLLTPIYHPNVRNDGTICPQIFSKFNVSRFTQTLVDVIRIAVDTIDNPDVGYACSMDMADEFLKNRTKFNEKASHMVAKHGLPRN